MGSGRKNTVIPFALLEHVAALSANDAGIIHGAFLGDIGMQPWL